MVPTSSSVTKEAVAACLTVLRLRGLFAKEQSLEAGASMRSNALLNLLTWLL